MAPQAFLLILTLSISTGLVSSVKLSNHAKSSKMVKAISTERWGPDDGWIDYVPWSVLVTSSNRTCSGIVLHRNWVLIPETCEIDSTGLDIEVNAGGDRLESAQQTVKAEIHHGHLNGSTILHLNTSLTFNRYVAPVRFPSVSLPTINYYPGLVAGFYSKTNDTHLAGYQTTIFSSLCPEGEHLCAFGLDWPGYNETTLGTDFLHLDDGDDDYILLCTLGMRKSQIGDNIVSYYPTFDMLPWIQQNLGIPVPCPVPVVKSGSNYNALNLTGLELQPTGSNPQALCGFLQ